MSASSSATGLSAGPLTFPEKPVKPRSGTFCLRSSMRVSIWSPPSTSRSKESPSRNAGTESGGRLPEAPASQRTLPLAAMLPVLFPFSMNMSDNNPTERSAFTDPLKALSLNSPARSSEESPLLKPRPFRRTPPSATDISKASVPLITSLSSRANIISESFNLRDLRFRLTSALTLPRERTSPLSGSESLIAASFRSTAPIFTRQPVPFLCGPPAATRPASASADRNVAADRRPLTVTTGT